MSLGFYLLALGVGFLSGGITSLIGASGVMIIVPILTMFFKINVHTAIGTSLFVDVLASLTISYSYYKNNNIELKSAIWIAVTSILGAQLGAFFANNMGEGKLSSGFSIVLIVAGLSMFRKSYKKKKESSDAIKTFIHFKSEWQKILAALVIGLGIGAFSGIFGAGGGVMILLALIIIMSLPIHRAIGTATLIMAITALSSTIGYAVNGKINLILGSFLACGAIVGGIFGARYANKVNEKTLQKVVGICFTGMGVAMVFLSRL